MNKRNAIILLILLLAIGFAAVTTTLVINGMALIGTNQEDFYVYFSEAIIDSADLSDTVISEDKQSINYTIENLTLIGEKSVLEYTVVNNSRSYDADIKVICEGESDAILVTQIPENQIVLSGTAEKGVVTVTINKNVVEEKEIKFTCTLNANAVERTELGEEYRECEYDIGTEWTYAYLGSGEEFIAPCEGEYKIELWGAQGGSADGYGAYVSGVIELDIEDNFFVYVGGKGIDATTNRTTNAGGWNGGADGGSGTYTGGGGGSGGGGGGATDIRLINQTDIEGIMSRIIVAAGGGGTKGISAQTTLGTSHAGGGLYGEPLTPASYTTFSGVSGTGGTQTSGGIGGYGNSQSGYQNTYKGATGSFASGGKGTSTTYSGAGGGGGGGYYGGGGGGASSNGSGGAGTGGSSFISGHNGCNAIAESSTSSKIVHTGQANHYSGKVFTNTVMIDGDGYNWTTVKGEEAIGMPTHDGSSTMTGNSGDGYAKITLLS